MNIDLIRKIINHTRGKRGSDFDPELLKQNLAKAEKILSERRSIKRIHDEMEEKVAKYKAQIRKMESEMYFNCSHMATTYYPDASGNNDSETICDLCELEI